jgi:protein-S-isoprenylcysteine O-methyltransferase Ste14
MPPDALQHEKPARPPPSATHFGFNCLALGIVLATIVVLNRLHLTLQNNVVAMLVAAALPIIAADLLVLRVHRRASTGLSWDRPFQPDVPRVLTKLLGLAVTIGTIALSYWKFPEYHGTFYDPLWAMLRRFWPALVSTSIAYFFLVDGQMDAPRDAYWQLGRVFLGAPSDASAGDIANHFRGWLVKAFFFPLMLVWLHGDVNTMCHLDIATFDWSNLKAYDFLYTLLFGLDLLFTTAGYALSLKVLDSHIRTAEPTMFGWAVALFCYQPFYSLFERQYVTYGGGVSFGGWLAPFPRLRWAWAAAILLLIGIYVLATIAFGIRFSNLTHRGILTNGPYRFTKHPAYVSKNLSWWLISVPFVSTGSWSEAVQRCIGLGCVNMIYFLRAKTEERHLSRDPTYVAYALWMNEHGALAFVGRWFPLLRYRAPASKVEAAPSP